MTKLLMRTLRAADLPACLREDLDARPEDEVRVTVDARPKRDISEWLELTRQAGEEARRNGLTDEVLADIVGKPLPD